MKKIINVECMDEFTLMNHDETDVLAEVEKGEYVAELYGETEEYFAKDSKGRDFLVGEINADERLILEEGFKLSNNNKLIIKSWVWKDSYNNGSIIVDDFDELTDTLIETLRSDGYFSDEEIYQIIDNLKELKINEIKYITSKHSNLKIEIKRIA